MKHFSAVLLRLQRTVATASTVNIYMQESVGKQGILACGRYIMYLKDLFRCKKVLQQHSMYENNKFNIIDRQSNVCFGHFICFFLQPDVFFLYLDNPVNDQKWKEVHVRKFHARNLVLGLNQTCQCYCVCTFSIYVCMIGMYYMCPTYSQLVCHLSYV